MPAAYRLLAAAVVLLLLAGTQAQSFWLFRCAYTGTTLTACCCPAADGAADADADSIARACCCQLEHVDASLPTGAAGQTLSHPPLVLVAVAPLMTSPRLALLGLASLPRAVERLRPAQPRAGPRLTIVHRRLLI